MKKYYICPGSTIIIALPNRWRWIDEPGQWRPYQTGHRAKLQAMRLVRFDTRGCF